MVWRGKRALQRIRGGFQYWCCIQQQQEIPIPKSHTGSANQHKLTQQFSLGRNKK